MRVNNQAGRLYCRLQAVTGRGSGGNGKQDLWHYFSRLHAGSSHLKIESGTENNERKIEAGPSSFPLIQPTEVSLLEAFPSNGQEVPVNTGSTRTLDCSQGPLRYGVSHYCNLWVKTKIPSW